jgi:hypothetical protein
MTTGIERIDRQCCAELLSAAFQIPVFVIIRTESDNSFFDPIHEAIFKNWFLKDRETPIKYDASSLNQIGSFLFNLASELRDHLYQLNVKNSFDAVSACQTRSRSVRGDCRYTEIASEWLKGISLSSIHELTTSYIQRSKAIDQATSALADLQAHEQGETFRRIFSRVFVSHTCQSQIKWKHL